SGAGKTLFLKALAGLAPLFSGSVRFEGQDVAGMAPRDRAAFLSHVGMTFQRDGLFDSLTCAENLAFPLRERCKLNPVDCEQRVRRALEAVGLRGQGGLFVHEMSGGMQKRLGIARALLFSPKAILYDEPAAGLDPITARSINELILGMR